MPARVGQTDMVLRMLGPKAKLRPFEFSISPDSIFFFDQKHKECESAVERCWTMLPDHRIVRDCDRWAEAYQIVNDHDGKVVRGTHRGPDGTRWLSFEYVEEDARIHADLYGSSGEFLRRKSTALTTRSPRLEGAGER